MTTLIELWNNFPNWGVGLVVIGSLGLYLLQVIFVIVGIIFAFKGIFFGTDYSLKDRILFILYFPSVIILLTPLIGSLIVAGVYDIEIKNKINPKLSRAIDIYASVLSGVAIWGSILAIILK